VQGFKKKKEATLKDDRLQNKDNSKQNMNILNKEKKYVA